MMHSKARFGFLAVASVFSIASCSGGAPTLEDYVREFDGFANQEEVKILQLTDIHWTFLTDVAKQKAYLGALIDNAEPDFLFLTGDLVLDANKQHFVSLFDFLDEKGVPYAIIWGNHDQQGLFDPYYPGKEAKKHSLCYYSEIADNVYGESNFVLNITDGSSLAWQLYGIDSNSLWYSAGSLKYQYDIIHEDEVAWYEAEVNKTTSEQGKVIPSLLFFHIPLWESAYAYNITVGKSAPGKVLRSSGENHESYHEIAGLGETKSYTSYAKSRLFEAASNLGSTKAMFYGHDHINSFCAEYQMDDAHDPIDLCYGLKTGDGLYYEKGMIGANAITIRKDGTYDLFRDYQSYESDYSNHAGFREEAMFQ